MSGNKKKTGKSVRLSVCLIVRNEEGYLAGALQSVRSAAHEIVVVDTGSKDRTVGIAREAGAKVIEKPWTGDFSAARNKALDAAGGDWVLCLDADERLAAGQEETLRRLLGSDADAWFVRIRSPYAGGRIYEHRYPRLFRNRPAYRFRGRVHEQIFPALAEAGARVRQSDLLIEHEGYAVERSIAEEKLRRNLHLLEEDRRDHPEDGLVLFHMGETYSLLGEPDEAVKSYRESLGASGLPPDQSLAARLGIATALLRTGDLVNATAEAKKLLKEDRDALSAILVIASAHVRAGENEQAIAEVDRYLGRARRLEGKHDRLIHHEPDPGRARVIRGEALLRLGRLDEAARDGAKVTELMPGSAEGHRLIGRSALAGRRFDEARLHFRTALEIDPARTDTRRDLALAALGAGDPSDAVDVVEEGLRHGRSESLLLCRAYLRIGADDLDGAIETYEEVFEINPHSGESLRKLAGLYRKTGRNDEALSALTRWREITEREEESGQKLGDEPAKKTLGKVKVPTLTCD